MQPVVLTIGASDSRDRQLMLEKIAFMAGVAEHENIVKFIASCNDSKEGTRHNIICHLYL